MPRLHIAALTLRVLDYSESSQLVTVLSREAGRIGAIAKGSKRPKSSFGAPLEPLILEQLVVSRGKRQTSGLWTLSKREMIEPFRPFRRSLPRYFAGLYVLELLRAWTVDEDPSPNLFDLSVESLFRLAFKPLRAIELFFFEIHGLMLQGHLPMLDQCVECGAVPDGRFRFSCAQGGLLCPSCRHLDGRAVEVDPNVPRLLASLLPLRHQGLDHVQVSPRIRHGTRALLDLYHRYLLHRPLQVEPYIRHL